MGDSKAEVLLNTPPIFYTNNNTNNGFLSFGDLFKGQTVDLGAIDTAYDLDLDNAVPFFDHTWRDHDLDKTADRSPYMSNGSPEFNGIAFADLEPVLIEEPVVNKDERKQPNGKRKRNLGDKKDPSTKQTRALQYPPCYVCGGNASGDHYGINTCEACKGFFRRYLLRKKGAYECKNGGHCEIVHTKKGMCAGCRLKKCLELGMSKDKCKLGRYSAEKRTEKIRTVKAMNDDINFTDTDLLASNNSSPENNLDFDIFTRTLAELNISDDTEESFTEELIPVLVQAKNEMKPFGEGIGVNNSDDIKKAIRSYNEEFQLKVKLYGEMKSVPKEDFVNLYQMYGIDVDNRLSDMREGMEDINIEVHEYCKFAKCVPYFSKLSLKDQSNLLKVNSADICVTLCCQGYDPELQIIKDRTRAYHVSEMDKIFSRELISEWLKNMVKCQQLDLSESEQVLVMAISLFFTDHCSFENPRLIDKIQLSLTQLLKQCIEKTGTGSARSRFSKIIGYLTDIRKGADMYRDELVMVTKDEIYGQEFPILSQFLVKDETNSPGSISANLLDSC